MIVPIVTALMDGRVQTHQRSCLLFPLLTHVNILKVWLKKILFELRGWNFGSMIEYITLVVLLYPDISNFTFWNVKILKCKIFLINFLDELGNFKQKIFYTSKCKIFLHFKATDPLWTFQLLSLAEKLMAAAKLKQNTYSSW